jgi:acyl-CoA reductase-like NAD-dependent aldehyde dehydrogenase
MARTEILKTYKIYIGGAFPRTESGRYYPLKNGNQLIANICLSSRKDFRNAVVAARAAFSSWSNKSAFNRSQILYRIAELMEGRKMQFIQELQQQGQAAAAAKLEVDAAIDCWVYYAGWCDKYQQLFSSVNPVSSPHFNFSVYEPTGVVSVIAPEQSGLLGLVTCLAPIIAGGNTCVVLASEMMPLCAITLAEVIHASDVPGGVVNILTGKKEELLTHMASHMDVNAMLIIRGKKTDHAKAAELSSGNVKRLYCHDESIIKTAENPYLILDFQELKTTWHPIENIGGSGGIKY